MTTITAPLPLAALQVGGLTLAARLDHEWAELQAHGTAACLICGEHIALSGGTGHCGGCGSELR